MFDTNSLMPGSGGAVLSALLYAGVSMFATGPLIGDRTIAKSGWDEQCRTAIATSLEASRPAPAIVPDLDCNSLLGPMFGREGQAFCNRYGGSFKLPFADQLRDQQRKVEAFRRRRLEDAAAKSGSRCSCAVNLTLETQRVSLAIYAGSLRLITPPAIRRLDAELRSALSAPQCAMKG